jgi:2-desacetyl-2-hydroxyethyl bacteriochlorophyllide A dehydrogenase
MRTIGIEYPERGKTHFCELGDPPNVKPGEILIRTHYSAITNGTERHALMGEHGWTHYPGRHGYQHVGTIEAAGSAVRGFEVDDWVFFGHYVGHRGWHIVDVSSEGVHPDPPHLTLKLPDDVEWKQCALFGVAGVALRHVRRCRVEPGQNVWVAGQGPIGGFCAQAAKAIGARVTVTDVNRRRLDVADRWGAHRALDASLPETMGALKEWAPYDVIVDGCGLESFYTDVHENALLARRGVIGSVAVRSETTFPWTMLHGLEASIEVSCHFALSDLRLLLHLVREERILIEPVISHVVPIDDCIGIYDTMRDTPGELLGVVFDWSE